MENYCKYIDSVIYSILYMVNIVLRILFLLQRNMRKVLSNNVILKKMRTRDECFVVGNGPSLNNVDLELLNDKDTFTVNFFFKHHKQGFTSKYFIAVDPAFYINDECKRYIDEIYGLYPQMIFILKYEAFLEDPKKWDLDRTFFISQRQFQLGRAVDIDYTKNVTACLDIVLHCIQVAIYMGYKKIYLLGCDFNDYASIKQRHYYSDYATEEKRVINMGAYARWASMIHYHHYALQEEAVKRGIEIINLTEDSLIDAYPRKKLDEILANC